MKEPQGKTGKAPAISVVAPVFNEEECLPIFRERLGKVLEEMDSDYEVVLVDDGSTDKSREIISRFAQKDSRWRGIFFARNFGHQAAISAGLDAARGKAVVVMDSDLQDPPEAIPHLLEKAQEGYDIVYARRASRRENIFKRAVYKFFYRLLAGVADVDIPLDAGDFTCMNRKAVDALKAFPERNRFVRGLRAWVGFRQTGLDVHREKRAAGRNKYTLRKLLRLAADAVFSFSWVPLRLVSVVGALCVLASLVYLGVIIYLRLTRQFALSGWTTTTFLIIVFGGLTLLALGIIGEYIGRIYDEVKQRPIYIVASTTDNEESEDGGKRESV